MSLDELSQSVEWKQTTAHFEQVLELAMRNLEQLTPGEWSALFFAGLGFSNEAIQRLGKKGRSRSRQTVKNQLSRGINKLFEGDEATPREGPEPRWRLPGLVWLGLAQERQPPAITTESAAHLAEHLHRLNACAQNYQNLTDNEQRKMLVLLLGEPSSISSSLTLEDQTLRNALTTIFRKLGCQTREEALVVCLLAHGYSPPIDGFID